MDIAYREKNYGDLGIRKLSIPISEFQESDDGDLPHLLTRGGT